MKQKILNFIQSTFNSSNKSRINLFLDILSVILFFASFFSIPIFSFRIGYTYVTWALSILLFVVIAINVSVYYKYRIDSINVSLLILYSVYGCIFMLYQYDVISPYPSFLNLSTTYVEQGAQHVCNNILFPIKFNSHMFICIYCRSSSSWCSV